MNVEFNMGKIREFMANFHNVTKIQVALFDKDFNVVLVYPGPWNKLCTWIKQSKEGVLRCDKSTTTGLQKCCTCGETSYTWRCHAGMIEWGFPLCVKSEIVGYIIFGQLINGSDGEKENIRQLCGTLAGSKEELDVLVSDLQEMDQEFIYSAAQLMIGCIQGVLVESAFKVQYDPVWNLIDNYIDDNLATPLRLDDIAAHAFVSTSTVSHKVKKITGQSVGELIQQRRMIRARNYLLQTDRAISEVAALVGLPDYNYFSRVFRKTYGYSPNEYRRYHLPQIDMNETEGGSKALLK